VEGASADIDVRAAALLFACDRRGAVRSRTGWPGYAEGSRHRPDAGGKKDGVLALRLGSLPGAGAKRRGGEVRQRSDCANDPIRCFARSHSGNTTQVSVPRLLAGRQAPRQVEAQSSAKRDEATARYRAARRERKAWLENLASAPANARVLPEDLSLVPRVAHLSITDADDLAFAELAAAIGRLEGFAVIAEVADLRLIRGARQIDNLTFLKRQRSSDAFPEDSHEYNVAGGMSVPAKVGPQAHLSRAVVLDRLQRFYPDIPEKIWKRIRASATDELVGSFGAIDFPWQGAVNSRDTYRSKVMQAAGRSQALRANLTYLEGGNVLTGSLPEGTPYALVGRDSLAISKALLEEELGRAVTDREVLLAAAKDLGVDPRHCHAVEQSGDYHLDMSMVVLAPGQVVVNDAVTAAELQAQWLRQDWAARRPEAADGARAERAWRREGEALEQRIHVLFKKALWQAEYEAMTVRDLEAAGLTVQRMAGRFFSPEDPEREVMNFLNGEGGTTRRGGFFVTQGGDPRAEEYVVRRLTQELATGISRLYFLDRALTAKTLKTLAGFNCRVKWEGEVAGSR
jgi:hypothetical protein